VIIGVLQSGISRQYIRSVQIAAKFAIANR